MTNFIGVEYARGATATVTNAGPALAPAAVKQMFSNSTWTIITADLVQPAVAALDRFGDALNIHKKVYSLTPNTKHILIGGDHSVNFGHFAALADKTPNQDLCLVYIDAHLDIHTPLSSIEQASGAPHGTNVRALLGEGDERWLSLQTKKPALKPENLFYIGSRSFEPAEINYVKSQKIYIKTSAELQTQQSWSETVNEIKQRIGTKPYVVSFDFDVIDPSIFPDVLVPEPNGLSLDSVQYLLQQFSDANYFEFVEYAPSGDPFNAEIVQKLISISV